MDVMTMLLVAYYPNKVILLPQWKRDHLKILGNDFRSDLIVGNAIYQNIGQELT